MGKEKNIREALKENLIGIELDIKSIMEIKKVIKNVIDKKKLANV